MPIEKLYTKGMIAKKYGVNLKKVDIWYADLRQRGLVNGGRMTGTTPIPDDPFGRWGIPENLVDKISP